MNPTRLKILFAAAGLLLIAIVWQWIANWGKVTIHKNDAPIAEIIKSIERQSGITLISNADPSLPVSMHVDKVTAAEAVDALAEWLDGNWSVTYVAAADKPTVKLGIENLGNGQRDETFVSFRARGGWGPMGDLDDFAIDPRKVEWTVSPSDSGELQSYMNQLSAKTGASALVQASWNPPVAGTPKSGRAADAVRKLVKSTGGEMEEVFYLRVDSWDNDQERGPQTASNGGGRDRGSWNGGGDRPQTNPEWAQERMEAQLAQIPAAQREQIQADMTEMRANWERIRSLPEDQRRAEMEKMFNDPENQERMLQREAGREGRRSPERRAERFREYIERKNERLQQEQQATQQS